MRRVDLYGWKLIVYHYDWMRYLSRSTEMLYSTVPNKRSATFINCIKNFQGLYPYFEGVHLLILTNYDLQKKIVLEKAVWPPLLLCNYKSLWSRPLLLIFHVTFKPCQCQTFVVWWYLSKTVWEGSRDSLVFFLLNTNYLNAAFSG